MVLYMVSERVASFTEILYHTMTDLSIARAVANAGGGRGFTIVMTNTTANTALKSSDGYGRM